jgi:hypothetical protein
MTLLLGNQVAASRNRYGSYSVEVLVLAGSNRKLIYPKRVFQLRRHLKGISLVHAHHAYEGAVARTLWKAPVVLTYHGIDALGTVTERGTTSRKRLRAAPETKQLRETYPRRESTSTTCSPLPQELQTF